MQMYIVNQNSAFPEEVFMFYMKTERMTINHANSIINSSISGKYVKLAAANFRKLRLQTTKIYLDFNGWSLLDIDPFYTGDASHQDLNNPNRQKENESYGYNYLLHALTFDGFTQFKFTS